MARHLKGIISSLLQQCKGYFYNVSLTSRRWRVAKEGVLQRSQYDLGNLILFVIIVGIDPVLRASVAMLE